MLNIMNSVKVSYDEPMAYYRIARFIKDYINENSIIVCIGTDKCIADCLGPFVGTTLKEKGFPYPVYGDIKEPIHALNMFEKISEINKLHPKAVVIAIDACLGYDETGKIRAKVGPVLPGSARNLMLPNIGDVSIIGIVEEAEDSRPLTLRCTRLNFIINMAKVISDALMCAATEEII